MSAPAGAAVLATIYTFITLATIIIAARVILRVRIQRQRLLLSDILMILAWCAAVTTSSFDVVFSKHGALSPEINYTLENYISDSKTVQYVKKMMWIASIPYFTTFFLCKASLLAVYLQIFPYSMKKRRTALWVVLGYCVSAHIVIISLQIFLCFPVERNWSMIESGNFCAESAIIITFTIAWGFHFSGSVAIFILPFLILYNLNMRRRVKAGVYAVFLLGLIDIIFMLIRFLVVALENLNQYQSITTIELWAALDLYIGLIIACLPSLRPYLSRNPTHTYNTGYRRQGNPTISPHINHRMAHSRVEEINDALDPELREDRIDISTIVALPGGHSMDEETIWTDYGRRNSSDIELVDYKANE